MYSYIIGILFLIVSTFYLSELGKYCFNFKNRSFSLNLILGYVVYTFIQAIGGITVQILQLPWLCFFWYMILILIAITTYIIYNKRKESSKLIGDFSIVCHLKNYWYIYVLSIILLFFSIMKYDMIWLANCLDDGYYLNLISSYPYVDNPYVIVPATGLNGGFFIPRAINTFEIEASFWVYLLKIEPTVFTRVIMNIFNYYLLLHLVYEFAHKCIIFGKTEIKEKYIQYFTTPVLLFATYSEFQATYILQMQDAWQFNTAMWFGSSIVRMCGFFLLMIPIIERKKIDLSVFAYCFVTSFALMSKASQALPIIIICAIGYLFTWLYYINKRTCTVIGCILIVILCFIPLLNEDCNTRIAVMNNLIHINKHYVLPYFSIFMLIVSLILKNEFINRWNAILMIFAILMWVPRVQNLFIDFSFYDFVAARATTTFAFTVVISSFVYLFLIINKILKNMKFVVMLSLVGMLSLCNIITIDYHHTYNLKTGLAILVKNPYIIPNSTYELSVKLNQLAKEHDTEYHVLTQNGLGINSTISALSIMLRVKAPNIKSISSLPRYTDLADETDVYKTFDQNAQWDFESFNVNPLEEENIVKIQNLLEKYPINCIVCINIEGSEQLEKMGFVLYDTVDVPTDGFTYYIMYK